MRSQSGVLHVEQAPPRFRVGPSSPGAWETVAELAALFGKPLDPWQETVLQSAMGERFDGRWAARYVMVSAPRQNGKSLLMAARAVAGALLLGEQKIVVSAHQQDTARGIFDEIVSWQDESPALAARIAPNGIMTALNRESIKFTNGARIQFKARSGPGGRGFSCDCLLLDEAQILSERAWASINSTMSARVNPQAWLLGTPPTPEDDSAVFSRMRASALGPTPASSLVYLEWSADPTDDPAGDVARAKANPAWFTRINHEVVDGEFATYSPDQFSRERLGIWDDDAIAKTVVDPAKWADCLDAGSRVVGPAKFVLDVSPSRAWASIAVAGTREDGLPHLEVTSREGVLDHRPGVEWVVDRALELRAARPGFALTLVSGSSAEPLIPALTAAGIALEFVKAADLPAACGLFFDLVESGGVRHIGQSELTDSLKAARKNVDDGEGAWRWGRRKSASDITPLYAVTVALWALTHSRPVEPSIYFL